MHTCKLQLYVKHWRNHWQNWTTEDVNDQYSKVKKSQRESNCLRDRHCFKQYQ